MGDYFICYFATEEKLISALKMFDHVQKCPITERRPAISQTDEYSKFELNVADIIATILEWVILLNFYVLAITVNEKLFCVECTLPITRVPQLDRKKNHISGLSIK